MKKPKEEIVKNVKYKVDALTAYCPYCGAELGIFSTKEDGDYHFDRVVGYECPECKKEFTAD